MAFLMFLLDSAGLLLVQVAVPIRNEVGQQGSRAEVRFELLFGKNR